MERSVGPPQSELRCPACSTPLPADSRFCSNCGRSVDGRERTHSVRTGDLVGESPTAGAVPTPRRTALESSGADPLIGQVIAGRYRILSMLGRGGMGVVYRVEHVHIGKVMAMKLLSGELASHPPTVRRFRREAKAVSRLAHPNTVQIFDFGEDAHMAYLVMEYLPGRDLAQLIKAHGALPFARVARIAAQVAASVGEAHQCGVIHRDLKPENLMVLEGRGVADFVKVLDFGIAKLRDQEDVGTVTLQGNVVGTPYYMAPEQIRAEPVDHRADIYALGALMYRACTGEPPFVAESSLGILNAHLSQELTPMRLRAPGRDVPEEAERIVARAMSKRPRDRYQSMEELREDLRGYLVSTGELGGEATGSSGLEAARPVHDVATRGDVDEFERKLRRVTTVSRVGVALLVAALAAGAFYVWQRRPEEVVTREQEPNDSPATANRLRAGNPLTGLIGKRISPTASDADVYAFEVPPGPRQQTVISVSALPNVDLVVDVIRRGEVRPLVIADVEGVDRAERLPNLGLAPGSYLVRVQERAVAGRMATENVSDLYTIAYEREPVAEGFEREPNESEAAASDLPDRGQVQGFVGWLGDRDVFCRDGFSGLRDLRLQPPPSLDLVLQVTTAEGDQRRDEGAVGQSEHLLLNERQSEEPVCVHVFAKEVADVQRTEPAHPYSLEVLAPEHAASP